ncbi:prevent-host-death protein [Oenococcus sp. UCMA 16435]|nr:prevent-host-death protein [Oenococcus sp. UCMA 16435]MDN6967804.1 prevent-host-death protein [Oenococcus sp. UCMA 17063]
MEVYAKTKLRDNIYNILKNVARFGKEVEITMHWSEKDLPNEGTVIMSKEKYEQMQELNYLQKTDTLDAVLNRMANEKEDDFDLRNAY